MFKGPIVAALTTLLSITAMASPSVYFCEMRAFVELTAEGEVKQYQIERFPMKVEGEMVSFGGDGYMGGVKSELAFPFNPDSGAFWSEDGDIRFYNNILTLSSHVPGIEVSSFIAQCDKF